MNDPRSEIAVESRRELLRIAESFADEARKVIALLSSSLIVEAKPDRSLVTQADTEIELRLRGRVTELFPTHGVIGEEFGESNPKADFQWIFDPIDGTDEFVHGSPTYGIVIGLYFRGQPLLGVIDHPALDHRTSGGFRLGVKVNGKDLLQLPAGEDVLIGDERAVVSKPNNFLYFGDEQPVFSAFAARFPRLRIFDSCFAYSTVFTGGTDLMFDFNTSIWDFSPCEVFLEELGGAFVSVSRESPLEGGKIRYCSVFGKKAAVERALPFLPKGKLVAMFGVHQNEVAPTE